MTDTAPTQDGRGPRTTVAVTLSHTDRSGSLLPLTVQHSFASHVLVALDSHGFAHFLHAHGNAVWDAVVEPTTVLAGTIPEAAIPALREQLATLATAFGQEAIGLLVNCGPAAVAAA